ncbi:hypothetical protein ACHAXM_008343 [Skeletonema potamos]|jgi:hypothetical protein
MSDSSSDGESSDDSILASPVFKKRDRRSERASKSKLSFLDACLNGTNARTDAQRRLAEVENGHINLENNVDKIPSNNDAAYAIETKEADTTKEADNDSDCSGKRKKVVITAPPKTTERIATLNAEQHNEEAYWDRVESFNSTNKEKMSVGIDADRGKLSDAMNGLDYTSETDDEHGKWNDGMNGMTRDQMRSEARAKLQGLAASIGLRRMFQLTNTKSNTCVYDDKMEAINELKLITTTLQKRNRNEHGESEAVLQRQILDPLNKVFKNSRKDLVWDLLLRFLQRNVIVTGKCGERFILPKSFCQWMWNAACSSYEALGHVSTACCQNLVKMIVNEMDIDDGTSFSADLTFVEEFSIDELISYLENDCGLWLGTGPSPSSDENIDHSAGNASPSVDVYAIKNIFLLWKAALDRDLIKLDSDNSGAILFGGATKAVTALTRVGIDPTFNLSNDNANNCIGSLPTLLQSLLSSLINSTVRLISKLHSESEAKKWIEHTTDRMVQACSNLSSGEEGDADHDDDEGWLPLACAAERMVDFEYGDEEHSLDVIQVKLNFAMLALKYCLAEDDSSDRENQLNQATTRLETLVINEDSNDATKRMLHMAMHALTHAEISLQYIDKKSDVFMRDHPRLLAAVLLSGECAFVALHVSKQLEACNLHLEAEEKYALVESMSIIETTCNNIKKKCTSVIAYPHLRRVKEYLTRLGKTIGGMKGKAGIVKRQKRNQGSLESWRRTSLPFPEDTQDNTFQFSQDSNGSSQGIFLESQD